MKSIKVVWLIALGSEGKSRLLTSDNMEESCAAAGVFPAGVPWATGSSTTAGPSTAGSWWCAGLATPAGSSSSYAGPSRLLMVCWAGNFCWVIHDFWLVIRDHDGPPCWPVTCWPVTSWPVTCWAVHSICLTRHCCRVVQFCWTRHTCRFVNVFWSGWGWNHSDGSSLWRLGNRRGQLYLSSGDLGRSRPLRTFTSSMILMMTRRGPAIYRRPWWWRRQGPTIIRWLVMMVMRMSGRPWRPDIRRPRWDTAWPRSTRRVSLPPGAGPSQRRVPGPLPTLSTSTVMSGWMMGPWWVMASVVPLRSSTALPTPWPVAFWPRGPGFNTVGPGPSHHGHAGGHKTSSAHGTWKAGRQNLPP